MTSHPGYDQTLLEKVPKVATQAGYDVVILGSQMQRPPSVSGDNAEAGSPQTNHTALVADEVQHPKPRRPSVWTSTRGKLLIGLIVVLVLAAAIGGGVGGALGKKSKPTPTGQGITGSDSASGSDTNPGTGSQSNSDGSGQRQ
ncbi:hypothetical protein FS837_006807 [Tulasnella sp. UAMH 9824]|nr:hypothetical protein FS837_006807 [Tulasnella sp. UAMH 9824]